MAGGFGMVLVAVAGLVVGAVVAGGAKDNDTGWRKIAALFEVPAAYQGDYGAYSSLLKFDDGRPVHTRQEWSIRRKEIRLVWMGELGPWPKPVERPHSTLLSEEH